MREFMYDVESFWVAIILFLSMAVVMEAGYRLGSRHRPGGDVESKAHVNAVQASLLGILALLLGFTFSLSLQRYDSRSEAVVAEANAIDVAYLRTDLLPADLRDDARRELRRYLDLRLQAGRIPAAGQPGRDALLREAGEQQRIIWALAAKAMRDDGHLGSGLFAQSINELIDAFRKRNATLNRHVPEVVLLLLYGTFVMAGTIIGYTAGLAGRRPSFVTYILLALIVVLVFIIIDLDRPRRGLITVSQASLLELQSAVDAAVDTKSPPAPVSEIRPPY